MWEKRKTQSLNSSLREKSKLAFKGVVEDEKRNEKDS